MNRLRSIIPLLAVLALCGCGTLDPTGPYAGDQVLYKADETIGLSYQIIHSFVLFEYTNRVALLQVDPNIKATADKLRKGAPQWFASAIALRDAYANAPSPGARDALQSALLVLRAATTEATKYLAAQQLQQIKP